MNVIWLVIIAWFVLGLLGASFKVLYWKFNGKRFNNDSNPHNEPITLDLLIVWLLMGPIGVFIGSIELLILLFEWMSNIKIFK